MLQKSLLILSLISLVISGGVHRVAQSRWNIPNQNLNTELTLFFALDNKLPSNGYINVDLSVLGSQDSETCNIFEITGTLDPEDYADSLISGTMSCIPNKCSCLVSESLNAGVSYGMTLDNIVTEAAG